MRRNPVLADPSQKAYTWPCKPWHLHFPPPSPWWHSWGLLPCYIRAGIPGDFFPVIFELPHPSLGAASAHGRERSQVLPWALWALDQGLAAQRVCSSSESLAALGQLMAVARPPCWLAPSCEQGAHSEVGGEEQLCERVSLSPLPSAYPRAPWCPFFLCLSCHVPFTCCFGAGGLSPLQKLAPPSHSPVTWFCSHRPCELQPSSACLASRAPKAVCAPAQAPQAARWGCADPSLHPFQGEDVHNPLTPSHRGCRRTKVGALATR